MSVFEYWLPFLYQYGVGLIIFLLGLVIILKSRSCNLARRHDRVWFGVLIFGFIWYASIHFFWYIAALNIMSGRAGGVG